MDSVNKVILVGTVEKLPEVHFKQGGEKIVTFVLKTVERYQKKDSGDITGSGTSTEIRNLHRIINYNANYNNILEHFVKQETPMYIEGKLKTRKYQDPKNGQDKYITEVVVGKYEGQIILLGERGKGEEGVVADIPY